MRTGGDDLGNDDDFWRAVLSLVVAWILQNERRRSE